MGTSMSQGSLSSAAAHRRRYHGLLKRSPIKNLRDDIFRFLDYVGTMAPSNRNEIGAIFKYMCSMILVMSCIPQSSKYWDRSNLVGVIMNVISVGCFIAPPSLEQNMFLAVAFIVEMLIVVTFITMGVCLAVFLKMSKFPLPMVTFVSVLLNGLIPLELLVLSSYVGRSLAGLVQKDGGVGFNVLCVVVGLILVIILLFTQRYAVTPNLSFRPQTLLFISGKHMLIFYVPLCCFAGLLSLGGRLDNVAGTVIVYVGALVLLAVTILCEVMKYVIGSFEQARDFFVYCLAGSILALLFNTLNVAGKKADELSFVLMLVLFIVVWLVCRRIHAVVTRKLTQEIEHAVNDLEYFDSLSYAKTLLIARYSFEWGYTTAHRWVLFEHMHRRFPSDSTVIAIFARYAAIYSDETTTLKLAGSRAMLHKKHNLELKRVLFEVFAVLQQREASMSPIIKKSIYKISAKIDRTRGQIRYLWECIIRGNLEELEGLAVHLKDAQAEIVRDYNQLCLIYPNNPYVAQSYAVFLSGIANDEQGAAEMRFTYQMLRLGKRTRVERCYFFASRFLPKLPTDEQHSTMTRGDMHDIVKLPGEQSVLNQQGAKDQNFDPNESETNERMQRRYLENMIDSVKIPSMRYGPIVIFVLMVILIPVCVLPVTTTIIKDINTVREAMEVVRCAGLFRYVFAELSLMTYQVVFSSTNVTHMIPLKERWEKTYGKYYPLPANWSTDVEAQRASLLRAKKILNDIAMLTPALSTSSVFTEALQILYSPVLGFNEYVSQSSYVEYNRSLEYIAVYMLTVGVKATTSDPLEFLENFEFWTMVQGDKAILAHTETFATSVLIGIRSMVEDMRHSIMIETLAAVLVPYVLAVGFNIFLMARLEKEKKQIFNAFKVLPKSALSAIIEMLNAQTHKEDEDGEKVTASAQEENALRVLSTSVDHGMGWIGRSWQFIVLLVIFTVAVVGMMVLTIVFSHTLGNEFDQANPLFMEIPRLTTQLVAITLSLMRVAASGEFPEDTSLWKLPEAAQANYTLTKEDVEYFIASLTEIINSLRIYDPKTNATGMGIGGETLIAFFTDTPCERKTYELDSVFDALVCTSFESAASILIQKIWQVYYLVYLEVNGDTNLPFGTLRFDIEGLNLLMSWILGFAKEQYVDPAITYLNDHVDKRTKTVTLLYILAPVLVCVVAAMVVGILIIPNYLRIADGARWSLRLLLFCQPSIVLQSKPILKILSNDFSENEEQKDQSGASFYETVVSNLLDGVIFLSNNLEVLSANQAVESVIGVDPKEILGKQLHEIFTPPEDRDSSVKAFLAAVQGALKCQRSPSIEAEAEVMRKGDCVTLGLSLIAVSSSGHVQTKACNAEGLAVLALVMKDMTSTIASNKLLVEEGIKSEKLLLMILPPIIVNKLQSGEKNISFSVKSASIMFVDIVSFTPWCGSNTADYVMSTLNRLFLEFDRILKKYDRMTKIKCIGDCYMCAGGIFDEINQPAEHTKQTVSFGIDIINALQLLNIELSESLRIRVGVNTGGPIVAGVLGIDKPTFDILGPDICLAAMMEHHGVPMHVHIPQHCYELIYASGFRIKERGDVEVKGKIYHTYVVSGYDHQD